MMSNWRPRVNPDVFVNWMLGGFAVIWMSGAARNFRFAFSGSKSDCRSSASEVSRCQLEICNRAEDSGGDVAGAEEVLRDALNILARHRFKFVN
jgi:hypothetical protein